MPPLNWDFRTLADAYRPRPPLEYAVDKIFSLPSLNIVYGPPGSLKSMLLADACLCVALGQLWLDGLLDANLGIKTQQMPTMWLDFDNGRRRTDERFDALGQGRRAHETTELAYVSMPQPWLDMTKDPMMHDLIDTIKNVGAKFVVIDNLGVISGDADENTIQMVRVMQNLRFIAEDTGAAVTVIHHQRKGNGIASRQGDNLRGHSSIEASLDIALAIEREINSDTIGLRATKVRGDDVPPFGAIWTFKHLPDSSELAEARFYGLKTEDRTSDYAIEDAILAAFDVSGEDEMTQADLITAAKKELDVGNNRIRGRIARMVKDGKLFCRQGLGSTGRGRAQWYSVAQAAPSYQQTQVPI